MDSIQFAIREALFERLRAEGISCTIGTDHVDCSYLDYSESIEVSISGRYNIYLIFGGGGNEPYNVRAIWSGSPMGYADLNKRPIDIDISEPDFKSTFDNIVEGLREFAEEPLYWRAYTAGRDS